jgi:hypothetical protein
VLDNIERGQEIIFQGILKSFGDERSTRHLHSTEIYAGTKFKEIPPHIHENGRYNDKNRG